MASTTFCIGSLPTDPDVTRLELGPTHPMSSGFLLVECEMDADRVLSADPRPGAMHRGAEMLFEVRDFRQALSLANRHDWQAPVFGELLIALLVETELGVSVPPRATWVRTLLAEHLRILSHLGFLTFVGRRLGRPDLATDALREDLRRRTLGLTGNRLHPVATRLGGVAVDPGPEWLAAERASVTAAAALAERILDALAATGLGAGVAPVSPEVVAQYGLAGPVGRASGVRDDLRVDAPTLAYPALQDLLVAPDAPVTGDAHARFAWLAAEVVQSAALVVACLDRMPEGELAVRLPNVVKLPEGDAHVALEAPLGRAGVHVVSRGDKTPWRLSLRTPSLANVSAWPAVLPGTHVDDLPVAVASLPYVTGDLDK